MNSAAQRTCKVVTAALRPQASQVASSSIRRLPRADEVPLQRMALQKRCGSGVPGQGEKMTVQKFMKGPIPAMGVLIGVAWYMNRITPGGGPKMSNVDQKIFGANSPF
mmetsp:Transcript_45408/g.83019  ORF Transcript_45408/g.83019 Transcript_45408/m.83019 type:complete len:108 (-) Transcript_45408:50-373(-)